MNPQLLLATVVLNSLAVASAFGTPTKSSASAKKIVTFVSPCVCQGDQHQDRWPAKTDPTRPPTDKSKIASITPSQIYAWPGVETKAGLTRQSPRIPSEQRWFALTGRVADVRIEDDGDIHVALIDADGNKPGIVGVEIPLGKGWCKLRELVFTWTTAAFPLKYPEASKLKLQGTHVITVTGKAFYDVDHAPKDHSNERPRPFAPGYSVWEIHPVMAITH